MVNFIKKNGVYFICFLLLLTVLLLESRSTVAFAQTDTITATITIQNVSVSVTDGTISYGTLTTSSSEDTTTNGIDDTQTATNNGNITQDLTIRGQNSANWTLSGTAGADQYTHAFCTTNCDASPTWTDLTTSNQTLVSGLAADGTQTFDLRIETPTSSSVYTVQSVDVILTASGS